MQSLSLIKTNMNLFVTETRHINYAVSERITICAFCRFSLNLWNFYIQKKHSTKRWLTITLQLSYKLKRFTKKSVAIKNHLQFINTWFFASANLEKLDDKNMKLEIFWNVEFMVAEHKQVRSVTWKLILKINPAKLFKPI